MPAPGRTAAPDVRLLALGLLAGILVIYALPRLPPWPLLLVPLPLLVPRWPGRAALAAALLGAALALHQADARLEARLPPADQAQDLWLTGTIASLPERKDQDWRFLFAPADGRLTRIRASWYRSEAALRAGACSCGSSRRAACSAPAASITRPGCSARGSAPPVTCARPRPAPPVTGTD
jgi:hypothetical protein